MPFYIYCLGLNIQGSTCIAGQDILSLITDFENLPSRFPNRYRSLKVIERSDNSVTVEEDVTVAGRQIHQITRHTFEPKHFLRSEVINGDTKGTVVEITLDPEDYGGSINTKSIWSFLLNVQKSCWASSSISLELPH